MDVNAVICTVVDVAGSDANVRASFAELHDIFFAAVVGAEAE